MKYYPFFLAIMLLLPTGSMAADDFDADSMSAGFARFIRLSQEMAYGRAGGQMQSFVAMHIDLYKEKGMAGVLNQLSSRADSTAPSSASNLKDAFAQIADTAASGNDNTVTLDKDAAVCLTDDFLALFNVATQGFATAADRTLFHIATGAGDKAIIRRLEENGQCVINNRDNLPIEILGTDQGYDGPDSGGHLFRVRIHAAGGDVDAWANEGDIVKSANATEPVNVTLDKQTPLCSSHSSFQKFFLATVGSDSRIMDALSKKGCSLPRQDTAVTVTPVKAGVGEGAGAYVRAVYPDGSTRYFWTYSPETILRANSRR